MPKDNNQTSLSTPSKTAGRKPILKEVYNARVKRACGLFYQGFSYDNILSKINLESEAQQWGNITMPTLRRDLSRNFNYKKDYTLREYEEHIAGDKEAFIARMEKDVETLRMMVTKSRIARQPTKDTNGNFVAPAKNSLIGIFSMGQMLMAEREILEKEKLLAQLKNFTVSVNVNNNQTTNYNQTNVAIYERANEKRADLSDGVRQGISDMLGALSEASEDAA